MSLFPLQLKRVYPSATGTADAAFVGLATDGFEYIVKTIAKTPNAPPAEWFCNRLADICGIATPQMNFIELANGKLAFGSRREGGVANSSIHADILSGKIAAHELNEICSKIYAFDLFVHNTDRHWNNYLFVNSTSAYSVKAIDFSRAWFHHNWPLPGLPMVAVHTVKFYRDLVKTHPFHLSSAQAVLATIRKVPVSKIQGIVAEIPTEWLSSDLRKAVVKWWATGGMAARVKEIEQGVANGIYL